MADKPTEWYFSTDFTSLFLTRIKGREARHPLSPIWFSEGGLCTWFHPSSFCSAGDSQRWHWTRINKCTCQHTSAICLPAWSTVCPSSSSFQHASMVLFPPSVLSSRASWPNNSFVVVVKYLNVDGCCQRLLWSRFIEPGSVQAFSPVEVSEWGMVLLTNQRRSITFA